jgi:hypothetical protein
MTSYHPPASTWNNLLPAVPLLHQPRRAIAIRILAGNNYQ